MNKLLSAIPPDELSRLHPFLERVTLTPRQVLFEEGFPVKRTYFPLRGFISYIAVLEDGPTVEAATVGPEGAVGVPLFIEDDPAPITAVAQVTCECFTMPGRSLRRVLADCPVLASLLRSYQQALLGQTLLNVACNTVHSVEKRIAKWLLLSADRSQSTEFQLTQEFLGQVLGVTRQTVARFAASLQKEGMIDYRRGRVTIKNRTRLAEASCSCYDAIRRQYDRILPTTPLRQGKRSAPSK